MWIVCGDTEYYPWVEQFDSYEKAKEFYDKNKPEIGETVYMAEVESCKIRSKYEASMC